MTDCIFCKISKHEVPAKLVYEDADLFAFEDIAPQAPTHILICSRSIWRSWATPWSKTARFSGARCLSPRSSPRNAIWRQAIGWS